MEIVLSLLTLLGIVAGDAGPGEAAAAPSRVAELRVALDQAVMLHEASAPHPDPAFDFAGAAPDTQREIDLDLIHTELETGFLAKSCVCDQGQVFDLRLMMSYAKLLRAFGESDAAITERIASGAGEHAARVRQLLDFAGIDGVGHFICVDYLREALRRGMEPETLRGYIDRLDAPPAPPGAVRLARAG